MKTKMRRAQLIGIMQTDHRIISSEIKNIQKMFMDDNSPHTTRKCIYIQLLISVKLVEHFKDEEEKLFPVLLAANPGEKVSKIIDGLLQEHEELLEEEQKLNRLFLNRDVAECKPELWTEMLDFLAFLKQHANKEEALFKLFPE